MEHLNEVNRKHLGIAGMNPIPLHDSSSRVQMFCSHLGQKLVFEGVEENYIQSGLEQEFAKANFRVTMPVTGRIKAIINKYTPTIGLDSIKNNPEIIIIYQDNTDRNKVGQFGIVRLPEYFSYHSYFGFNYVPGPGLQKLRVGEIIEEGTVFLETPTTSEIGGYPFGKNANVALMTLPEDSEDGIIVSESFIQQLIFYKYETRIAEWGKNQIPLNIYGDNEHYKIFPDIGENIRDDGLLMALRDIDDKMAIVDQNVHSTKIVDNIFDTKINVVGGGTVIDIDVVCNDDSQNRITENSKQLQKYIEANSVFNKKILDFHKDIVTRYGSNELPYTPELWYLIRECLIDTNINGKEKIQKLYKKSPLDYFRVKFVIKKKVVPDLGFKITNLGGCKGVICDIRKDEDMPIDKDGNRADIIMDPKAYVNRMTMSGLIAHFLNATSRDIAKRVRNHLGIDKNESKFKIEKQIRYKIQNQSELIQDNWNYIMSYYKLVSPIMFEHYSNFTIQSDEVISNLTTICSDMIYLYTPVEYTPDYSKVIPEVNRIFKPLKDKVLITKKNGEKVWTKEKVMIGSMYIILLEKIGDELSAVASGKLQHHGLLAQLNKQDKYAETIRNQPIKGLGEPDVRNFVSYCGAKFIAELMDRNNNPIVHKKIVRGILDSDQPTNIDTLIDRKEIPYGATKPIQFLDHLSLCSGWKFGYHSRKEKGNE